MLKIASNKRIKTDPMPAAPPKGWDRYMPHEPWAPDHQLVPIVGGLISWFRGGGRAMLKTVS